MVLAFSIDQSIPPGPPGPNSDNLPRGFPVGETYGEIAIKQARMDPDSTAKAIENKGHSSLFEYGWALRYGIAPITVALGLAVRSLLAPVMTGETVYTYFVPSVLVSAWLGGLGPDLLQPRSVSSLQSFWLPARRACQRRRSLMVSLLFSSEQLFRGAANCCTRADAARWQ